MHVFPFVSHGALGSFKVEIRGLMDKTEVSFYPGRADADIRFNASDADLDPQGACQIA